MNSDKDMDVFDTHVQALTNSFASNSVDFLQDMTGKLEKEQIASLLIAAAVNFFMKTTIVAGFSKEELKHMIDIVYDPIKSNDVHAQVAEAIRQSRKETKQ